MSRPLDRLEESWATLTAAQYASDQIRVEHTGTQVSEGAVMAGLDAQGRRYLLVPLSDRADAREDRRSAGVQIEIRELTDAGRQRVYAAAVCLVPVLNDIFASLAADMLAALDVAPDRPGTALLETLDRWRSLLERPDSRLLGPQQLAGLFGELMVLKDICIRNPLRGLDAWTGPGHDAHDFTAGDLRLEVKATTVREGRMVEVHGVGQLAVPHGSRLWLTYFKLAVSEAGISVPDTVEAIAALGVRRRSLLERLAQAGYDAREAAAYMRPRFEIVERRTYLVDDAFPKIVPESFPSGALPAGVLRLRYEVDLTGEPPVPLGSFAESDLLDQLATRA